MRLPVDGAGSAELVDPCVVSLVEDQGGLVVRDDPGGEPLSPGSHGSR